MNVEFCLSLVLAVVESASKLPSTSPSRYLNTDMSYDICLFPISISLKQYYVKMNWIISYKNWQVFNSTKYCFVYSLFFVLAIRGTAHITELMASLHTLGAFQIFQQEWVTTYSLCNKEYFAWIWSYCSAPASGIKIHSGIKHS